MSPARAPPLGPRAANGISRDHREPKDHPSSAPSAPADPPPRIGPHPGKITSSTQYTSESTLRAALRSLATPSATSPTTPSSASTTHPPPPPPPAHPLLPPSSTPGAPAGAKPATHPIDPAREDSYRLQGIQLLDSVRERLQLPLRTFDTACVYYHRFRLSFHGAEYAFQDAALASLFVACKVEDTIKKSKDILAAAYNVKNPEKTVAPDDKILEASGKILIGLERMILETIGFDFRTRYPQKLLAKTIRAVLADSSASDTSPRSFFATAYAMSIDMYRTFVPIKRTTFAMVSAVTELTALVLGPHRPHVPEEEEEEKENGKRKREEEEEEDELVSRFRAFALRKHGPAGRHVVLETMLDILDLYVQHPKATRLGVTFDINHFMDIKIHLNQELEASSLSRHLGHCPRCEFAATSGGGGGPPPPPSRGPRQQNAQNSVVTGNPSTQTPSRPSNAPTMRFVFDPETAREERGTADTFFKEEFEEYEIEVDEPIPPPPPAAPHAPRRERDEGGGGRGRRFHGGGGGHGRDRWGGGGGGHYRGDRRRGRRH